MKISGITYVSRKRKSSKTLSTMFLILVVFVLFTITFLTGWVGWNLIHPTHVFADKLINKADFNTITDISFTDTQKKVTLSGWLFKSANPQKILILSHGYGDSRMLFGENTKKLISSALEHDYSVLTFDYRGHGTSEDSATTLGYYEKHDLAAAINYAKSSGFTHICVLGHSMGAAIASIAVAENPGLVDAVILDSSFADLKEYLDINLPIWSGLPKFPFSYTIVPFCSLLTGLSPSDVSPVKAIEKIPAEKIMIIHSKNDNKIPYSDSQQLFKAADSAAVYWTVEDALHGKIFETYTNDYLERIFAFMEKRLVVTLRDNQQTETPIIDDSEASPSNVPNTNTTTSQNISNNNLGNTNETEIASAPFTTNSSLSHQKPVQTFSRRTAPQKIASLTPTPTPTPKSAEKTQLTITPTPIAPKEITSDATPAAPTEIKTSEEANTKDATPVAPTEIKTSEEANTNIDSSATTQSN